MSPGKPRGHDGDPEPRSSSRKQGRAATSARSRAAAQPNSARVLSGRMPALRAAADLWTASLFSQTELRCYQRCCQWAHAGESGNPIELGLMAPD